MIRLCEKAGCTVLLPELVKERALYPVSEIAGCTVLLPELVKEEVSGCVVLMPELVKEEVPGCVVLMPELVKEEVPGCVVLMPELVKEEVSGCVELMPELLKEEVSGCVVLMPELVKERALHPIKGMSGCTVLVPWMLEESLQSALLEETELTMTGSTIAFLKETSLSLNEWIPSLTIADCIVPLSSILKETTDTIPQPILLKKPTIPARKIRYPRFLTKHKSARLAEHAVN